MRWRGGSLRCRSRATPAAGALERLLQQARRQAPASRCRVRSGAFACRLARASRRASGRALALALLAVLLLQVPANDIEKKEIAQENACANGLNTITVTLQVTICSRNHNAEHRSRAARVPRLALLESLKHRSFAPSPAAGGEQAVSLAHRIQTSQCSGIEAASLKAGGHRASRHKHVAGDRFAARILTARRRGSECAQQQNGHCNPS